VLFAARQQGQAKIDVITGDPWHAARAASILIVVEQFRGDITSRQKAAPKTSLTVATKHN
jgi:hypothetical protein